MNTFHDLLLTFKWRHIVDILVVSFIIHRIFLLLRGRNAFQMILGLISIFLLQIIARISGLVLTSWFLGGLGAVALIAIVVLFRWEFRELLMQTNFVRFFLGGRPPPLQSLRALEPLITAVFMMAHSRTGALIVLQNQDRLSEYLMDGYDLNGRMIPQIIHSIFSKQSPLHDGAIVISGNRIRRVGAFLPLTASDKLPMHFGTRHRAAIGLTESTDAIVLVVSEERGEVSLVEKGSVTMMSRQEDLRDHLTRVSHDQIVVKSLGHRTRSWLIQIAGFTLIASLVSAFWGIYFGKQSLIQFNTKIDFRNISEDIILKNTSRESVDIQISGNRIMVNDLESTDIQFFVNLKGLGAGIHTIDLEGKNVELPAGLTATRVSPQQVRVELDKVIKKKVMVQPLLRGNPPDDRQITHIQIAPDSVVLSGPSSDLVSENFIYTNPINLNELKRGQDKARIEVPLTLPHASIELSDTKTGKVQVVIELGEPEIRD